MLFLNKGFISGCPIRGIFVISMKMGAVALPFCQTSVSRGQGFSFSNGSLQSQGSPLPRSRPYPRLGGVRTICPVTSSASSATGHPRPGQELGECEKVGARVRGGAGAPAHKLRALSSRSFSSFPFEPPGLAPPAAIGWLSAASPPRSELS